VNPQDLVRRSKFLALVLRHAPETVGVTLDRAGWVSVTELLAGCERAGKRMSLDDLREVVTTNNKRRFEFNEDCTLIRARQGHSTDVDLEYEPCSPPELLYHGTYSEAVEAVRSSGLKKMKRHHVHLSTELRLAMEVGSRRGKPVLVTVQSGEMHRAGHVFYLTGNNVWLVDEVPPQFLSAGS
jgi:putative RNA 2'-phosphotransferase